MAVSWYRSILAVKSLILYIFVISILCTGCSGSKKTSRKASFEPVAFDQLMDWSQDDHLSAFEAFSKSCSAILRKKPSSPISNLTEVGGDAFAWQKVCLAAKSSSIDSIEDARDFFEKWFSAYKIRDESGKDTGRITGYYEIEMRGSRTKTAKYKYPIYKTPHDLERRKGCKGFCHASINRGALQNKKLEIVWVDSMARRFFLHIQGSGVVILKDGKVVKLGYASQNGFPYKGIGTLFSKYGVEGICSATQMMEWIEKNPRLGQKIMEENQSYVFFKEINGESPIGGQGVPLTPERTVAIDASLYPYGALFWLETNLPNTVYSDAYIPYNRLMVGQDTGGAIKGAIRADLFFGRGKVAEELAGSMSSTGRYYILLPKGVKVNAKYTARERR